MAPVPSTPVIQEINSDGFKILAGATEATSGIKGVKVTANGTELPADKIEVNEITAGGITFTIIGLDEDQPYNIDIVIIDNAGNESISTATISESTVPAIDPPVITILNNDTWTASKQVTVPAVEGYYIKYTTDGTNPTKDTTNILTGQTGTQSFTLNDNGTVKAVYYSIEKGTISKVGQATTDKIDTEDPSASISITSLAYNTINVTATGSDTQSGVTKYEFQMSTASADSGFTTVSNGTKTITSTTETNTQSFTYTFSGSAGSNPTRWVKVITTDSVGRTKESNVDVNTKSGLSCMTSSCSGSSYRTCYRCGRKKVLEL